MTRLTTLLFALACALCCRAQSTDKPTGILLVHYGTQNDKSREATIDRLDSAVTARFPQCRVVEAYAAGSVIKALGTRGIRKLTISQGLDSLRASGCRRVVVQSTMLLDGLMTDLIRAAVKKAAPQFETIKTARPLLYNVTDCRAMAQSIERSLKADTPLGAEGAQVVLVGHGSDSPANAMYSQMDYMLKDEGRTLWHVGTIEGYPTLEAVARRLKEHTCRRVVLVPLLYIAGNHQRDDIEGHWKPELERLGYEVSVVAHGLGETEEMRALIADNIKRLLEE